MNKNTTYFVPGFSGSAVSAGLKKWGKRPRAYIFSKACSGSRRIYNEHG